MLVGHLPYEWREGSAAQEQAAGWPRASYSSIEPRMAAYYWGSASRRQTCCFCFRSQADEPAFLVHKSQACLQVVASVRYFGASCLMGHVELDGWCLTGQPPDEGWVELMAAPSRHRQAGSSRASAESGKWHEATDDLAGNANYGQYDWNPLSAHSFSTNFGERYTNLLVATGDLKSWIVLDRNSGCIKKDAAALLASRECTSNAQTRAPTPPTLAPTQMSKCLTT